MVLSTWKAFLRPSAFLVFLLFVPLLFGCSGNVPVSGKLTVDGQPLSNVKGSILFIPDKDKGNSSTAEPKGVIDEQGNYTLTTDGKPGAPPGKYKVVINVGESTIPDNTKPTISKSPIDPKYSSVAKTDLVVEVPAGPFDFKLTAPGTSSSGKVVPAMPK
jgi:hypothetical protein